MIKSEKTIEKYFDNLSKIPWIFAPHGDLENVNPFLYYIRVLNGRRESLREHMKKNGIDTGIHWQSGHSFSYLNSCKKLDLKITEKITQEILSLPLHSDIADEDVDRVINAIKSFN